MTENTSAFEEKSWAFECLNELEILMENAEHIIVLKYSSLWWKISSIWLYGNTRILIKNVELFVLKYSSFWWKIQAFECLNALELFTKNSRSYECFNKLKLLMKNIDLRVTVNTRAFYDKCHLLSVWKFSSFYE